MAVIGGLRHHVGQLEAGRRLTSIADGFAASSEFTRRCGYPELRRNAVDAILGTDANVDHVVATGG